MSEGRQRLQVNLNRLLLSTSSIGAGAGCLLAGSASAGRHVGDPIWWHAVWPLLQLLAGGPLIGAGILGPSGRARLGAYFGFFVPILAALGYGAFRVGWKVVLEEPVAIQTIALTAFAMLVATCGTFYRIWKRRKTQPVSENPISD